MNVKLTQENKLLDLPDLNRFRIGDHVVVDASDVNDRFEGVIIGIEMRRIYGHSVLTPCITLLHDGYITDEFKPIDCRKVEAPAPAEKMVGWQLMETAPKDGRDLLLTSPDWNGDVMVGSFAFGKWRERPSPDGASMTPTHWMGIPPLEGTMPENRVAGLTRLAIRIGGEGTPGGAYAYTEADDDGDYVFFTEARAALFAPEAEG